MTSAKEYFEHRRICRQLSIKLIGRSIENIIRDRATKEERKLLADNKVNAMLGKEISELREIKEKYNLSWNEIRKITMNWK